MAFIEVHQSLRDHRKILALAAELDMPEAHVSGHCVYLWLWSLDNAEDGALPRSERIIERAAGWQGAQGVFVKALVTVGMVERDESGALHIHDWMDYAGRLIEKRRENAERMRAARAARDQSHQEERATHVQRTTSARAGATVPNRTVPNSIHTGKDDREVKEDQALDAEAPSRSPSPPPASQNVPNEAHTAVPSKVSGAAAKKTSKTPAHQEKTHVSGDDAKSDAPTPLLKTNPLWDALVEVMEYAPTTKPERSNWGKVVRDLREAAATPEEIRLRAERYIAKYDRERLTVNALVTHWSELARMSSASQTRATTRASPVTLPDVNISGYARCEVDWNAIQSEAADSNIAATKRA